MTTEVNPGEFSVSVSKTIPGTMDGTLDTWVKLVWGRTEFSGIPIAEIREVSKTDKWRYWRAILEDGSHVVVTIYEKMSGRADFTITHEKLTSAEAVENWRAYWKEFLRRLA